MSIHFYRVQLPFTAIKDSWLTINLAKSEVLAQESRDFSDVKEDKDNSEAKRELFTNIHRNYQPQYDHDNVNRPSHYNSGRIEVIEALEDWRLDFHCANAVKYVARAGRKDSTKEVEDLQKAVWYLNRKIENLKAAKEQRAPLRPNEMVRA
jgi:hypothetical protein